MEEARKVALEAIDDVLNHSRRREPVDRMLLKKRVRDDLTKFLYQKTKRKPMILPVIMDV